jgi:hypothetical protein
MNARELIPEHCHCGARVVPGMNVCRDHWHAIVKAAMERSLRDAHRTIPHTKGWKPK